MKKSSLLKALLVGFMCFTSPSMTEAEIITIESDGYSILGEEDNVKIAKERARQDALRQASEQAGVYVSSYYKVNHTHLTDDELIVISSGLLKVENESIVNETLSGQGFKINCHIIATFDTDNIDTMNLLNSKTKELKKKDDELEQLNQENIRLKEQLNTSNESKLKKNEEDFQIKLYERELIKRYSHNNNTDDEMDKLAKKIGELDPDNYTYRNYIYNKLASTDPNAAIDACNKYLETHPDDLVAACQKILCSGSVTQSDANVINKAKEVLPKEVYYSTIPPAVLVNGQTISSPADGLTLEDNIYRLFDMINGTKVRSFTTTKKGNVETNIILFHTQHPDDIDGKECENILKRYEKIYFVE